MIVAIASGPRRLVGFENFEPLRYLASGIIGKSNGSFAFGVAAGVSVTGGATAVAVSPLLVVELVGSLVVSELLLA